MDTERIKELLQAVRDGRKDIDSAVEDLKYLPFEDLCHSRVDHHRSLRKGFPEVIFGEGKSTDQLLEITEALKRQGGNVLVTRLAEEKARILCAKFPEASYHSLARVLTIKQKEEVIGKGMITVISAGTSDISVAEEAYLTAQIMGNRVERVYDVGVSGIHRLFSTRSVLDASSVLIVVAGMEGALPSVVGGLTDKPVVAVPTSIGYGASFGGIAALLAMLNSCASGVAVVNIDNGFGAGYIASLINRL